MGKGRSNNAGKSNRILMIHLILLNKSQPTEKKKNKNRSSLDKGAPVKSGLTFQNNISMD